jgi:hypothetical protein
VFLGSRFLVAVLAKTTMHASIDRQEERADPSNLDRPSTMIQFDDVMVHESDVSDKNFRDRDQIVIGLDLSQIFESFSTNDNQNQVITRTDTATVVVTASSTRQQPIDRRQEVNL